VNCEEREGDGRNEWDDLPGLAGPLFFFGITSSLSLSENALEAELGRLGSDSSLTHSSFFFGLKLSLVCLRPSESSKILA